MFFSNGMVYGGTPKEMMKIVEVKPLENMTMILTFNSGEQRLYDATTESSIFLLNPCMKTAILMRKGHNLQ